MNPEDPSFNPGGLPYIPKPTDWQYQPIGAGFAPFDWEKGYDVEKEIKLELEPTDQSPTSCGGHAGSNLVSGGEALKTGSYERRSAKDIYSAIAVFANGQPIGSYIGDILEYLRKTGDALESLRPSYDNGQVPTDEFMLRNDASSAAIESRKLGKISGYSYIQPQMDLVGQAIRDQGGVLILLGGQNNKTWKSKFPKPPSYRQWGHFVYGGKAVRINGKDYIGILNSDGKTTGDRGWQYLGRDYFESGFIEAVATVVYQLPPVTSFKFTRDLYLGVSGADVKMLQKFLNLTAYPVAASGPGSPGQETTYFGGLTKTALAKYQAANGISPAVGYLGPITRNHINNL